MINRVCGGGNWKGCKYGYKIGTEGRCRFEKPCIYQLPDNRNHIKELIERIRES
jgi:hypothetical protein